MRGQFFAYLGLGLVGLVVFYALYMFFRAVYSVFADAWTNRELDKLAKEYTEKRDERKAADAKRLDPNCKHLYGDALGALPPDVCRRCGKAKQRPKGACDHVWRILPGPIPSSRCEKCDKNYSTVEETV